MSFYPNRSYFYKDIGLVPRYFSKIRSRKTIDMSASLFGISLDIPVLIAPMETVVNYETAIAAYKSGILAVLPRRSSGVTINYLSDLEEFAKVKKKDALSIPSISAVDPNIKNIVEDYIKLGTTAICIDVANGYHIAVEEAIKFIRSISKDIFILAGNIASIEAYEWCCDQDISAVRVGIGPGQVCSTSLATGIQVGQASLVREIARWRDEFTLIEDNTPLIIADGGIKTPGCIAKALALGADFVMAGNLFSGSEESPASIIVENGIKYKEFSGQASKSIKKNNRHIEGIETFVPCKGSIKSIVMEIKDGLSSSMAYMNSKTMDEFRYQPIENFALFTAR